MTTSSFHKAFNARHLKPEDVAKTFIYNSDYEELIQDNHTVLLGARGCGKTTLMKMLTLPALNAWEGKKANEIKSHIKFYPIYISTDIYWNAQKDAYNSQLSTFPKYSELISKVAVTTNVLYALCESFENIIKHKLSPCDEKLEIELSKELIDHWLLPPTIPNIQMVKEALLSRTDKVNRHIQQTLFNHNNDKDVNIEDDFFYMNFDSASNTAISTFERIYKIESDSQWAFCFDELELAPQWLQNKLFKSLRSRSQKFLYKLSASPIVSISKDIIATPGNDLKLVKMWPHKPGKKYQQFSETLVQSIIDQRIGKGVSPEEIFGSNPLLQKEPKNDYDKGGQTWKEVKQLAKTDETLKELLLKNKINPENPAVTEKNKGKLDTVLRKIKPIVYFRNYYSTIDSRTGKRKARSRKSATLFYGKEVIYKICDGNPRWLIWIVNEMLSKNDINSNKKQIKINPSDQATVLFNVAKQFKNVIATAPDSIIESKGKGNHVTLAEVLEEIGNYFFKKIVLDDFHKDPHSTFYIDNKTSENYIRILEKGVYQGAIVLIDPAENAFDFEMRGKRFRLSYLFCPMFKIPLRKYSKISLSNCLANKKTTENQSELPFDK